MALRSRLSNLKNKIRDTLNEAEAQALARVRPSGPLAEAAEEPPVVARLMVEIRSDGSRTIARGAIEDIASGERATIEAKGVTPIDLAASLVKTLLTTPLLARSTVRAMFDAKRPGKRGEG